ncbi:mitochondrial genome maintenance MGM101 [Thelephora ganbajun]|uniref:Mitochondrial genome maintenance MGM101 n=1 Tax=Thelephora ganbajun TaxID=370292 RepID=A0ACB6ZPU4_THEGA|nr:mitochondrial genome maintenance MGM101 [Thelephora ganbajun]
MASRVTTRSFRTTLSLMRQSRLSPSLSRGMVYVASNPVSKGEPKKSTTAPDLTAEDLDQLPSHRSASTTTSNGNGNGSGDGSPSDWSRSFHGLSSQPFDKDISEILLAPVDPIDVEIKPDGLIYLPEIKYRRILNKAFGPGGWGLAPRSETNVGPKVVSREYALVCLGRLVGIARGEQEYFDPSGIPTATEACKSNALMRCCKDLGIASELWDPRYIREFKAANCVEVYAENVTTKKKKKLWRRKDQPKLDYPWKE